MTCHEHTWQELPSLFAVSYDEVCSKKTYLEEECHCNGEAVQER